MDRETFRFINTFAPWLAALGTFAAVVTSLYLARRYERISLKISLGIRKVAFVGGTFSESPDFVWAEITNWGRRTATLTNIWFRPFLWGKAGSVWIAPKNRFSSPFPITLGDGESANYVLPIDEFQENFKKSGSEWGSGKLGRVRLRMVSFGVTTSTGQMFSAIPEKAFRQLLLKMAYNTNAADTDAQSETTP